MGSPSIQVRRPCVRVGEYAPHPVVTTCWSADIARQMTTCFGMDEGLDWHKRRSDRDFFYEWPVSEGVAHEHQQSDRDDT